MENYQENNPGETHENLSLNKEIEPDKVDNTSSDSVEQSDLSNQNKSEYNGNVTGLNGLSKAYRGRDKISGHWEENIDEAFRLYETI